ncbi:hypothetical protein H6P81_008237 [Aristolochia fimbriata]|uniref:Embryo defective 2759 n=1 Tax=Aristolochia fimbriata TaxID=158543 RepID=A0AAV7F2P6_ARIFI|nr:hypothetical protein H6P81_008237 [Aristolochia fimbriata]
MALIVYQPQSAYASSSLKPAQWNKVLKLRGCVSFRHSARTEGCISFRHRTSLSGQGYLKLSLKTKPSKILAFKGGAQKEGSEGRSNASKFPNNPSQLSYAAQEKEDSTTSEDVARVPLSYASEGSGETVTASVAIQNLLKRWLIRLQTQTPSQNENGMFEGQSENEVLLSQPTSSQKGASNLIKAAVAHFFGLDAAIKFPLLLFIPWYLAINVAYGAEVSRELTPLWVFGPLIVALYIKLVQGKLKEFIHAHVWQPVEKIKNLNYREQSEKKLAELKEWAMENYLDFVESVWPYYCRTIRFLKKANLI